MRACDVRAGHVITILNDHLVSVIVIVFDDLGVETLVTATLLDDSHDLLGWWSDDDDESHDHGPGLVQVQPHGKLGLVHHRERRHDARDEHGEQTDGRTSPDVRCQLGVAERGIHLLYAGPTFIFIT